AGAAVAVGYRERAAEAAEAVEALRAGGASAMALPVAIESRAAVRDAVAKIAGGLGPVDILVNNAAIADERPFESIDDDAWDRMLAVNLRGPFACAQECLPGMLERGFGRIVNLASIGGQWGGVNQVHYATAKAGLIGLTRSLAKVYSGRGVTTNAISPGLVRTEMSGPELETPAGREKLRQIPIGRTTEVDEVAASVVFLAGDAAGSVTGQTLNVNGGLYFG
ncbi:MAG: SDR family oxidoreductase, partial [Proteobacteria bacterium]|nr:SDR family oxidoreductase [Pseudomonadota bacterium]